MIKNKIPTTRNDIIERLKHVMNPMKGLDIVQTGLLYDVILENGKVTVILEMEETDQFAANLSNEIIEQLQTIWDVKSVEVKFNL